MHDIAGTGGSDQWQLQLARFVFRVRFAVRPYLQEGQAPVRSQVRPYERENGACAQARACRARSPRTRRGLATALMDAVGAMEPQPAQTQLGYVLNVQLFSVDHCARTM